MTTYTWSPASLTQQISWNTPSDWFPAATPNSFADDAVIPEIINAGSTYPYSITIAAGKFIEINSLSITDNAIEVDGKLEVAGTLTLGQGSTFTLMPFDSLAFGGLTIASGGQLVDVGNIADQGSIDNDGLLSAAGSLDIRALTNNGVLEAGAGNLEVTTNLANFSAGTLTAGIYETLNETMNLNVGGLLVTDAAGLLLDNGEIETSGTPLNQTLQTIAASGLLSVQNMNFASTNSLDDIGRLVMSGGTFSSPGLTIQAGGVFAGYGTVSGPVTDDGNLTVTADQTATLQGQLDGSGTIEILAGSYIGGSVESTSLTIANPSASLPEISFDDWNGKVVCDNTTTFNGTISGFSVGLDYVGLVRFLTLAVSDVITLNGVITGYGYSGDTTAGMLTLQEATGSITLNFLGDYNVNSFVVATGPSSATISLVLPNVAPGCLAAGTLVETETGLVAVEALRVGDRVVIAGSGLIEPIVWIGSGAVNCEVHPKPEMVWPVRVRAGAFAENVPRRDLWLSPDHAVYVDEVLIPIKRLVNGATIAQIPKKAVTYYHVELPRHDVLLAEGMAVESYLDAADRHNFDNGGQPTLLHPDFSVRAWEAVGCARLVVTGPERTTVRERVNNRAARVAAYDTTEQRVG